MAPALDDKMMRESSKAIERVGFPVVMTLIAVGIVVTLLYWDRQDRIAERVAFIAALEKNTASLRLAGRRINQIANKMNLPPAEEEP